MLHIHIYTYISSVGPMEFHKMKTKEKKTGERKSKTPQNIRFIQTSTRKKKTPHTRVCISALPHFRHFNMISSESAFFCHLILIHHLMWMDRLDSITLTLFAATGLYDARAAFINAHNV